MRSCTLLMIELLGMDLRQIVWMARRMAPVRSSKKASDGIKWSEHTDGGDCPAIIADGRQGVVFGHRITLAERREQDRMRINGNTGLVTPVRRRQSMPIDWASVNWGYVLLLSGFAFIAALIA